MEYHKRIEGIEMKKYANFVTLEELKSNLNIVDQLPGIYSVFYKGKQPNFLEVGTGGHFKGKDPNVTLDVLQEKWLAGVQEIYIGKAYNLRSRLDLCVRFGQGEPVRHYGGRYIWQIEDQSQLIFAWKAVEDTNPREVKKQLIQEFKELHGSYPFAKLRV